MASSENELEQQLLEVGNRLLTPPSLVDELLSLLDQVESFLSRVEQSPSELMQNALCPSMKALVTNEVLRHSDIDVKVAVASCISEITRITAPDAPYDDEQMKEFFQLVVEAFEKLYDMSSLSFPKRVSILVTVAKVRSCVVMLDLECDALILKMFQHFLKAIRENHSDTVFSSMETIMSLVLEESEDISSELLSLLLTSVKNENQDVLPIARKLGGKVLKNCSTKLKPYLTQLVQSMGVSLNDYSEIVASICQETFDSVEHNNANASAEHLAEVSKFSENTGFIEPPQVAKENMSEAACPGERDLTLDKSPRSVMSNGTARTGKDDSLVDPSSPKRKLERSRHTNYSKNIDAVSKAEPDSLGSAKDIKHENKPDQVPKKTRGRKPNSAVKSIEASDCARIESKKEAIEMEDGRKSHRRDADSSLSVDPSNKPTTSHNETVNVTSPSPSQNLPDGTRPKRGRRGAKNKGGINQEVDPGSPLVSKEALSSDQLESEGPQSSTVISKKESEGTSDSEAKPHRRSGKKALSGNGNEEKSQASADASKKESEAASDSEAKPLKQLGKKANVNEEESSAQQEEGKKKRGRGKTISGENVIEKSSGKKIAASPKSTTKSSNKDQSHLEEISQTKSKRKRTPGPETPETPHSAKEFDENMVGSKIKVWWPKDKMFYEGVVDSFDPVYKKHKVIYVDGDQETLFLKKERWEFVGSELEADKGQPDDLPSPDATSEMPGKKKAKANSDLSVKKVKTDASLKRGGGSSTSKSKDDSTKSASKSREDGKLGSRSDDERLKTVSKTRDGSGGKSKDNNPKTGTKSKEDASKPSGKSKDERPRTGTKSMDETHTTPKKSSKTKDSTTPKTGTKSKDENTKTGSKSSVNGSSVKGKSSLTKVQETDDSTKEKSSDSAKALESETKVGKKRRRNVNS